VSNKVTVKISVKVAGHDKARSKIVQHDVNDITSAGQLLSDTHSVVDTMARRAQVELGLA